MRTLERLAVLTAVIGTAFAQPGVVATSASGQTNLTFRSALVTFVPSNANTAEEAVKSAAVSAAEGHAIAIAAARTIPIPVVGPYLAGPVVGKVINVFHPNKPITGFNVAFLPGLSSESIVQQGEITFTVPSAALQGGHPLLVRAKVSSKDSARIVRSVHASLKLKNSQINPMASDNKILGVDEDIVVTKQEIRGSDIILTPANALGPGEYAVIIAPAQQDALPVAGNWIWDFRVM